MAETDQREIQVRTLTGESTTISVQTNYTIEDLKLCLKQSFPPAVSAPNFHLFFKGVKLRLQCPINTHRVERGEFLVLVPFTKKDPSRTQKSEQSTSSVSTTDNSSISDFASSAWADIMNDLSYLREASDNGTPTSHKVGAFSLGDRTEAMAADIGLGDKKETLAGDTSSCTFEGKRKRSSDFDKLMGLPYDYILSALQFCSKDVLEEHNREVFVKILESVNCLAEPNRGLCLLSRKVNLPGGGMGVQPNDGSSCLCPEWLKIILKAFAFVNIFSAFLHLQQKTITTTNLEKALNQLGKSGIKLSMKDIKHVSILCPKVVRFSDNDTEKASSGDAPIIINCSSEQEDRVDDNPKTVARKRLHVPKIVSALKRRECFCKTNLLEAVELLMCKNGTEMAVTFSLEDLLLSVKNRGAAESGNEAKRARRSRLASISDTDHIQCHDTNSLLPVEMVEHLRKGIGARGQIVHIEDVGGRKATHVEIPNQLSENMKSALKSVGVTKLYSHQAESIQASLSGKNVVVATMTSSGKSLCYNLPVLEVLSQNLLSCALYLFPTKALAQDQLRALLDMTKRFDATLNIGIYDGDTSQKDRPWLRDNARLLITNPDMLHISILPDHKRFGRILSNLRFVIIDEAHAYKGAFGCHTALIIRRLRRLCSHVYGSDPSFVFSTATSANPREHCMELSNLPTLELIQNDGSPSARKLFILWNPIVYAKTLLKENRSGRDTSESTVENINLRHSSPLWNMSCLFAEMVQHGLRCIAFCKSRKLCEIVLSYTREILHDAAPNLVDSICVYRAGYIAGDRRRIERDFFDGKLCGVAATNALELGIDVGHIDVTLHLGFPGSIASLWQQAGRAGRRERPSLAVYVAFEGPLDQYFMNHPKKLFGSPIECCHIDAQNQQVLEQHLVCAACEYPLSLHYDDQYFGSGLNNAAMSLKSKGYLISDQSCDSAAKIWNYIGQEKMPSRSVSIRAIENVRYEVLDQRTDEVLEEIEESRAFFQVYEGAVYMRQGKTYLVTKLDLSNKIALCKEADLKYYTRTRDYTDVHVNGGNKIAYPVRVSNIQLSKTTAKVNTCKVTTNWFGFHRIWRGSNQIFDTVELSLPSFSYDSQAVWIPVPQSIKAEVNKQNFDFRGGLHAASHAILNVVPLHIICNSADLAPECPNPHDSRYYPERILLYDQHPGGIGVSVQVQPLFTELLMAALEVLRSCYCSGDAGCPNCVQVCLKISCLHYNPFLNVNVTLRLLAFYRVLLVTSTMRFYTRMQPLLSLRVCWMQRDPILGDLITLPTFLELITTDNLFDEFIGKKFKFFFPFLIVLSIKAVCLNFFVSDWFMLISGVPLL